MLGQDGKIDAVVALRLDALRNRRVQHLLRLAGSGNLNGRDLTHHVVGHDRLAHDLGERRLLIGTGQQRIEFGPAVREQIVGRAKGLVARHRRLDIRVNDRFFVGSGLHQHLSGRAHDKGAAGESIVRQHLLRLIQRTARLGGADHPAPVLHRARRHMIEILIGRAPIGRIDKNLGAAERETARRLRDSPVRANKEAELAERCLERLEARLSRHEPTLVGLDEEVLLILAFELAVRPDQHRAVEDIVVVALFEKATDDPDAVLGGLSSERFREGTGDRRRLVVRIRTVLEEVAVVAGLRKDDELLRRRPRPLRCGRASASGCVPALLQMTASGRLPL